MTEPLTQTLSDEQLDEIERHPRRATPMEVWLLLTEVRAHRAAEQRVRALIAQCDAQAERLGPLEDGEPRPVIVMAVDVLAALDGDSDD